MRWLITGGAGFIGSNLVTALLRNGGDAPSIVVLDNFSAVSREQLSQVDALGDAVFADPGPTLWMDWPGVRIVEGDIRDADLMMRTAEGADVIVHLAANTGVGPSVADPRADCEANVMGTLNCLEAARSAGIGRFIFASSGAPAGFCEPPITEDIVPRPASPYGASKLAGEAYCCAYARSFGLSTVALRFSNVYGPHSGRKGSVVATFIRQALAESPITINGDGRQTRDFIFVEDLVDAICRTAKTEGVEGELFQVATGRETSVQELLALLRHGLGRRGLPEPSVTYGARSSADVLRNFADNSKARRLLGWSPETSLEEGLERTLDWFTGVRNAAIREARPEMT